MDTLHMGGLDIKQETRIKEVLAYCWIKHMIGDKVFLDEDGAKAVAFWAKTLTLDITKKGTISADTVTFIRINLYEEKAPTIEEIIIALNMIGMSTRQVCRIVKRGFAFVKETLTNMDLREPFTSENTFVEAVYQHIVKLIGMSIIKF